MNSMENIKEKIVEIINNNIKGIKLQSDQAIEDLSLTGMDSIKFISIIITLEEEFDIEIPDEYLVLTEMNTISKMADVISTVLDNKNNSIGE